MKLRYTLITLVLFTWCSPKSTAHATDYSALHLRTGERHWSWLGGPQPTVVTLAGSVEDSLDGTYAVIADRLARDAGALSVSIDLPAHGTDGTGTLNEWADRIRTGDDLIGEFIIQLRLYLAYLIEHHYTDPNRIALVGVSRGAFLALHAAAQGVGTQAVAVMPVVTLASLMEFADLQNDSYVERSHLSHAVWGLYRHPIYVVAGVTDPRVNTGETINFWRNMTVVGPSPNMTLLLAPSSVGHMLDEPQTRYAETATWIANEWSKRKP